MNASAVFIKLLDLIYHEICMKFIDQFYGHHLRSRDIKYFMFLLVNNISLKVLKIEFFKFPVMEENL